MKHFYLVFLFSLLYLPGFCQNEIQIKIDPTYARGGPASQVFDEIEFIPLETSKESLFGKVVKMEVTDSLLVVSDIDTRSILFFSRGGMFLRKIDPAKYNIKNLSPEFTIDREKGEIIVTSFSDPKTLFFFNFEAILLRKRKIPDVPASLTYIHNTVAYTPYVYSYKSKFNNDTLFRISYFSDDTIIKRSIPYNVNNTLKGADLVNSYYKIQSNTGDCFLFSSPLDYRIIELDRNGVSKVYKLILPQSYSLPLDFLTNQTYANKRFNFVNENKHLVYKFDNTFRIGNCLIVELSNMGVFLKDRILEYNLKTRTFISWNKISPDQSTYQLPLFYGSSGLVANDVDNLYISIPSMFLFNAKKNIPASATLPKPLKDFFDKGSAESNPVIVRLKLKQSF